MPYYRKKKGSDTWHWCTNCPDYPKSDYDQEWHSGKERPSGGELDNTCKSMEEKGTCTT